MKKFSVNLSALIALLVYLTPVLLMSSGCMEGERNGLLKLLQWSDDKNSDCCGWERVKCDNNTHPRIIRLDLNSAFVVDGDSFILDASLFLPFQQLQYLDLSENNFSDLRNGHDFGKLKKLKVLFLSNNYFNDTRIFQCLSTLTSLTVLDLSRNNYEHSNYDDIRSRHVLDASLFLPFQQLQHLDLSENSYSDLRNGHDLGKLKKLRVLILAANFFNNTRVFQSLSALASLTVLDLSQTFIMGGSLSDFSKGLCKMKNLRELDLRWNMFSGSIHECFKDLTSLKSLDLSYNNLIGNLRPFALITSLEYFSLTGNQQLDTNLMVNSFAHKLQFKYLALSDCNQNISTSDLVKFLHNQPSLMFLDLSNNNLYGEFPNPLFKNNSELQILSLSNNSLTGHIHLSVGPLLNIKSFDVSYNHIQGELQSDIGQILPKLKNFNVANNKLGGGIPTSLGKMKELEILNLANNKFSGKLPERLGLRCRRLGWIQLSNNRIEGQIPYTLFNLTKLYALDLSNNQFTGSIPSNIFQSTVLGVFNVNRNHISGTVPPNLTDSLLVFSIGDNFIEGYIPLELCNLISMEILDLSQNQLSGPMPSCLTTIPYLQYLHLQHNKLTYPTQKVLSLSESSLLTLDLSYNNLSGEIPVWFGFFRNLVVLLLKENRFNESIPHELCRLHTLGIMDLSHNKLSGSIPLCFTNISFGKIVVDNDGPFDTVWSLYTYTVSLLDIVPFNLIIPLSTTVFDPTLLEFSFQENVEFLTKSRSNSYKGDIIKFMSGMDLSCNDLKGSIPMDIGALTEIHALNLSHNQLTGVIPSSLSNMKQIESLDFSCNKLSGEIPSSLTRLSFLEVFSVAYNNLSGRVPEMAAQFSTFNESSYEGNPFPCGPPLLGKPCNINADQETIKDTSLAGRIDMFGIDPISFFASFAAAYVTCLLGFVIVLYINPYWRRRWFHFINACLRFVFPFWSEAIDRSEN